jgi:hypothetical protein
MLTLWAELANTGHGVLAPLKDARTPARTNCYRDMLCALPPQYVQVCVWIFLLPAVM